MSATTVTIHPLTALQELLLRRQSLNPADGGMLTQMFDLEGPLDRDALRAAVNAVVERHEALRTTLPVVEGVRVQLVSERAVVHCDVRTLVDADGFAAAVREANERQVDIANGPLLAVAVLSRHANLHRMVIRVHHAVVDYASLGVLVHDFAWAYGRIVTGHSGEPTQAKSYVAFLNTQRAYDSSTQRTRDAAYWASELSQDAAELNLPESRTTDADGLHQFRLGTEMTRLLSGFARDSGTTFATVLMAIYARFLLTETGQTYVSIGTSFDIRDSSSQGVVAHGANMLPVLVRGTGAEHLTELTAAVGAKLKAAHRHRRYGLGRIIDDNLPPTADHSSVYQCSFHMYGGGPAEMTSVVSGDDSVPLHLGPFVVKPVAPLGPYRTRLALGLSAANTGVDTVMTVKHNPSLVSDAVLHRLERSFAEVTELRSPAAREATR
jgi:hypothetical protein